MVRAAGLCAIVAGLLRCITAVSTGDDPGDAVEGVYLMIDTLLVFSMFGLVVHLDSRLDARSIVGFVSAVSGLCLIVGPDAPLGGVDLYPVGAALVAVGTAALVWPARSSELVPRWAVWALVLAVPVGSVGGSVAAMLAAAGVLFGLGMVGVGAAMTSSRPRGSLATGL